MRIFVRYVLPALVVVGVVAGLFIFYVWEMTSGGGFSKKETAQILVNDLKFGGRATGKAIRHGDEIIPLIRLESADFAKLNGRNSLWIADVLGAIKTGKSRAVLLDLYSRTNELAKVTGAVGLARHQALPGSINESNLLVQIVRTNNQKLTGLAIIGLGRTKDPAAVPFLLEVLQNRPNGYFNHAHACEALARIGSKEAIPVLRQCLQSNDFHALPNAFRALIALGDRQAVPFAIARVSPALRNYNSGFVVRELKMVTGRSYGYDREKWQSWWMSAADTWQIPERFLKPWDQQENL